MPKGGKSKLQDPDFSNHNPDADYQEEAIVAIVDSSHTEGYRLVKVSHHTASFCLIITAPRLCYDRHRGG